MNIAHISGGALPVLYRYGGANERRIVEVAREQSARGHRVSIYSIGADRELREVDGIRIHFISCRTSPPFRSVELLVRANVMIARESPPFDVLHFHGMPEGAIQIPGVKAKRFLTYDYFYFRRVRRTPFYSAYRRILLRFDTLFPVSEYCRQESQRYWKLPAQKCMTVYNGVNLTQFHPDSLLGESEKARLGIDGKVILYVGRVCRQKGTDVLLEAFRILSRRDGNLRLVVAGPIGQFASARDPDHWEQRIADAKGLYLGSVDEGRLASIYNMADVFVMPTREFEMFCMAAVEVQACGKPVVASDHGGLREVVPETCGARFRIGDARELADKVDALLGDHARYARCRAGAIENASQYSWPRICDRLETLYGYA